MSGRGRRGRRGQSRPLSARTWRRPIIAWSSRRSDREDPACGCLPSTTRRHCRKRAEVFAARQTEADAFYARCPAHCSCPTTSATCSARPTPGCCGPSSSTTTTCRSGSTATRRTAAAAAATAGPQRRLAHLYTATSSRCPTSGSIPGSRPGTSAFHCVPMAQLDPEFAKHQLAPAARVVHAPERPAPGLRVGLRRRQPAGARLGRLARLSRSTGS